MHLCLYIYVYMYIYIYCPIHLGKSQYESLQRTFDTSWRGEGRICICVYIYMYTYIYIWESRNTSDLDVNSTHI